ncbi:MAG: preprotein translocase subunit SecE [bacterium]|nr:preprotein translocase subunit SecE [bacterium]
MSIIQYLKDTQGELRHVAWPTRLQTVVYTILVTLISIGVALYLGLFDYLFTSTLARFLGVAPTQSPITVTQPAATSSTSSGQTTTPVFSVDPASTTQ